MRSETLKNIQWCKFMRASRELSQRKSMKSDNLSRLVAHTETTHREPPDRDLPVDAYMNGAGTRFWPDDE